MGYGNTVLLEAEKSKVLGVVDKVYRKNPLQVNGRGLGILTNEVLKQQSSVIALK